MADIPVVQPSRSGAAIAPQAASAGGDQFDNNGETYLVASHVNGAGAAVEVEIASQVSEAAAAAGQDPGPDGGSVGVGEVRVFGPFPPRAFNDPNNKAQVSYPSGTESDIEVYCITR